MMERNTSVISTTKGESMIDTTIDHRFLGLEPLLAPFAANCSSQRLTMFASNITQALLVDGAEFPKIFTGYENVFGEYEFNTSVVDKDIQILAVIPKFQPQFGSQPINGIPSYTIIYLGCDDNVVDYFEICDYTALYDGFGYINSKINTHLLKTNQFVPKGTKFYTSPIHEGNLYKQGVNANVLFATEWANTEDAFIISESLANKMEHTAISSLTIPIKANSIPLNLYGDNDTYRIMPDIGEQVRDDGILIAFRNTSKTCPSLIADICDESLQTIEYCHDHPYYADVPGATIIDVQVYTNPKIMYDLMKDTNPFNQLAKYQIQHNEYYKSISKLYTSLKSDGYNLSSKFNNLVFRSMGLNTSGASKSKWRPMNKKTPVDFLHLEITYMYKRKLNNGFKITGRDGAKGVVSSIWKDEDMPVDQEGFKADIVICPVGGFNRMNPSQFYEQFFNRSADIIKQRAMAMPTAVEAFNYILEFIADVHPQYASDIKAQVNTEAKLNTFMREVGEKGIYLWVPPMLKNISEELIIYISEKYNITESKYRYTQRMSDGTSREIISEEPGMIGSKYIYLLGKLPEDQLQAVESSYVSHFMTPIKIVTQNKKQIKSQSPLGRTPIRFGGDESCILVMSCGIDPIARMMGMYGNAPEAVNKLQRRLLSDPYPSKLSNVDINLSEITGMNANIDLISHILGACGIEVQYKETCKNE